MQVSLQLNCLKFIVDCPSYLNSHRMCGAAVDGSPINPSIHSGSEVAGSGTILAGPTRSLFMLSITAMNLHVIKVAESLAFQLQVCLLQNIPSPELHHYDLCRPPLGRAWGRPPGRGCPRPLHARAAARAAWGLWGHRGGRLRVPPAGGPWQPRTDPPHRPGQLSDLPEGRLGAEHRLTW